MHDMKLVTTRAPRKDANLAKTRMYLLYGEHIQKVHEPIFFYYNRTSIMLDLIMNFNNNELIIYHQ